MTWAVSVWLLPTLGRILVPGIYDLVAPMTAGELSTYDPIDFDPVEYAGAIGTPGKLLHSTKCVELAASFSALHPPPLPHFPFPRPLPSSLL